MVAVVSVCIVFVCVIVIYVIGYCDGFNEAGRGE